MLHNIVSGLTVAFLETQRTQLQEWRGLGVHRSNGVPYTILAQPGRSNPQ
jgi:hypothetical protein